MATDQRLRAESERHYLKGDINAAISVLFPVMNQKQGEVQKDDLKFLGLLFFSAGNYDGALQVMMRTHEFFPDDIETVKNIGVCLQRLSRHKDALKWLQDVLEKTPQDAVVHDALASSYGAQGQDAKARAHGNQALTIKDHAAANTKPLCDLTKVPLPPFDPEAHRRNVISFSLWGQNERYLRGALRNADLVHEIYPGWSCRFYCDETVPAATTGSLMSLGADVIMMPKPEILYEGLFWRFQVAGDPTVDRYLVRDADSIINLRERAAVDEWVAGDKHFHLVRDMYTHTDPMLAGLWGGVRGALPDLTPHYQGHLEDIAKTANCDQKFLREAVWPVARQSCLIHSDWFDALGAKPFPATARLAPGRHVGQNADAAGKPAPGRLCRITAEGAPKTEAPRQKFVFTITTGRSGTSYLAALLKQNLPDSEVHHERTGYQNFGVHTPDASHFMLFNSRGNVPAVRDFWQVKLGALRYGDRPSYVEASHFLAKAGLIENLALLGPETEIHLINLRRDLGQVTWSLANRMDFLNTGFTWLFGLDWRYPRNIVDPKALERHGMMGRCLWYAIEMQARGEYYRHLLAERPNIQFHDADLKDIASPTGAQSLLRGLDKNRAADQTPDLPGRENASTVKLLGDKERAALDKILAGLKFDPAEMAAAYIKSGRRLG